MGYADNMPTVLDERTVETFTINEIDYTFDVAPDAPYARAPVKSRLMTTAALYPMEVVNAEVRAAQLERDLGIRK